MQHASAHPHTHLVCMLLVHAWSACADRGGPASEMTYHGTLTTLRFRVVMIYISYIERHTMLLAVLGNFR